ncbi:hypothetical protein PybrP1_003661 [[Pythium] brassicae (nom. inval.)]|nr:hypothetical protein PybrP1_003661 [[Pythium] brassicae (nom. inval.)]
MDLHTFACLFSALPHTQTLETLRMKEPNALFPWKLPRLECAWLLYATFHPFSATSSWRHLELHNCDPSCLAEALDLPRDRKLEIISATRLFQLQRNRKRKRADSFRNAVAEIIELCDLQTLFWLCVLIPGFGFGWSLVRVLGPFLESLELKTGRIYSCLLKDIAESCPRLQSLQIKTKMLKLKGSALRQFFSDSTVAQHLRSLTLGWGICNPRVLLDILTNVNQYAVANALEKLHICYVRTHDFFSCYTDFVRMLRENLALEKLYLSGDAPFERLWLLRDFNGAVVAQEKTVRARLAFLSVVSAPQQQPELATLPTLAHDTAAPEAAGNPEIATSPASARVVRARARALGNLSVDLIKVIFAFGVTQRVIGAWPPASTQQEEPGRDDVEQQLSATATKSKLEKLMTDFATFDGVMRVGTRQRKERDEFRLAEMKQEMARLERKLETEIKKRVETNKSLQNYCDEQVALMTQSFEALLAERAKQVNDRLDALAREIAGAQSLVEQEKIDIPLMIENKTNELTQKLVAFMDAFEQERQRRASQEESILKRLSDHEHATAESFECERRDRELKYSELKNALDSYTSNRIRGDERFQTFAQDEIAKIQNALVAEAQAREREDDEIIEALNRYTAKLQDSLKAITSADT